KAEQQADDAEQQQAAKDSEEIGREEAARILDALEAEERSNQQERLRRRKATSGQVDKDW
ncbi:hypothetical protein ACFL4G_11930, partial [Thermodesulfobacteriota bacterium]